ncbi:hypothetical protein [Burkholderia pseudomallei]|uniref:hypothetical protein n=1 Tax=Burkholderia pseudomallei TaxID=28450 RepID=UPI00016AB563|nr:hypothetical protein [Burkholderia pseudomallei]EEH25300.1 hypothetical protein BUH_1952 [Burkholderia pseudomallei Pakistan 9]ONB84699.1 hypothetical protein AQ907_06935 [Burkholderia pseudomallei]
MTLAARERAASGAIHRQPFGRRRQAAASDSRRMTRMTRMTRETRRAACEPRFAALAIRGTRRRASRPRVEQRASDARRYSTAHHFAKRKPLA